MKQNKTHRFEQAPPARYISPDIREILAEARLKLAALQQNAPEETEPEEIAEEQGPVPVHGMVGCGCGRRDGAAGEHGDFICPILLAA